MKDLKNGVHDPTIIKHKDTYYLFSTDTQQPKTSGVPIRSSKDLIHWDFEKSALSGVPKEASEWSNAVGLWAPEIIKVENEFRMYYSASSFGSTTSFIGLATAPHPLGPWEDKGEVVKTSPDLTDHNAIDANICEDRHGNQWMVYGSFFGGIYIAQIDKNTGKFSETGFGKRIAKRPKIVDTAIEGPFIIYNPETDYFYLFVSYDSLNDFYNIRVARSKSIDGPYKDFDGNDMLNQELNPEKVGTKLLGGYQFNDEPTIYAPGHNSILVDGDNHFLIHHARRKKYSDQFFLQIRSLFWLENGWPVVAPYEHNGDYEILEIGLVDNKKEWEIILFKGTDIQKSKRISDIFTFIEETKAHYKVYKNNYQYFITGMTDKGYAFFGK